ncbi:MAG: preprotein translocase subunit SecE [Lachnospiraceae bacterium]|nr:preprotein translocase subunit SecE [Lachnospiraceae bacterium]
MADNTAKKVGGQKRSWFKGLRAEFSKVVWPTKKTLARQTVAVVAISIFLGALITIVDTLIQYGLDFILVR